MTDRQVLRGRVFAALLLVVSRVVPVLFLSVGSIGLKSFDAGDRQRDEGLRAARAPLGPSTGANIEEKTRCLDAGGEWCFTVGRGSYDLRDVLHRARQAVFVRDET